MVKADFEAFKAQYAETCCIIQVDNSRRVYVGYPHVTNGKVRGPKTLNDIEVVTFGEQDFLKVPYMATNTGNNQPYTFYSFIPLDVIQGFHVCEEKGVDGNYILIDPYIFN